MGAVDAYEATLLTCLGRLRLRRAFYFYWRVSHVAAAHTSKPRIGARIGRNRMANVLRGQVALSVLPRLNLGVS